MYAVWQYLVEHCDITENGSYFIKFHTNGRKTFEKHVRARWKHDYKRIDERSSFDYEQKEKDATSRREAHLSRKQMKKQRYKLSKEQSRAVQSALKRRNDMHRNLKYLGIHPASPLARLKAIQALAKLCYTFHIKLCLKNRPKKKTRK